VGKTALKWRKPTYVRASHLDIGESPPSFTLQLDLVESQAWNWRIISSRALRSILPRTGVNMLRVHILPEYAMEVIQCIHKNSNWTVLIGQPSRFGLKAELDILDDGIIRAMQPARHAPPSPKQQKKVKRGLPSCRCHGRFCYC
jgi:hypothetical protein